MLDKTYSLKDKELLLIAKKREHSFVQEHFVKRCTKFQGKPFFFSLKLSDNPKFVAVLYYRNRSIIQRDILNNRVNKSSNSVGFK